MRLILLALLLCGCAHTNPGCDYNPNSMACWGDDPWSQPVDN